MEERKYLQLWRKYLPVIKMLLKKSSQDEQIIKFNEIDFDLAGSRELSGYTFNLEIEHGKVSNDISGTAVARDLYKVLSEDAIIKEFIKDKKLRISMGKTFVVKFKVVFA